MTRVLIVGGGGAQGSAFAGYLRTGLPGATLVAVDRQFSDAASAVLDACGAERAIIDVVAQPEALIAAARGAEMVVNLAGPFYRLGTRVLDAAIAAGTSYLDICDDIDATRALLARDDAARAAGCAAVIGMGAAPGTTNLLVRLAIEYLGVVPNRVSADIAWCAPASDLTYGIFEHLVHCFRTALPDRDAVPEWQELSPRIVTFADPIGAVETTLLGHPEPLTLARHFGCTASLRGGMTSPGVHARAWQLARECDAGLSLADAWSMLQPLIAAGDIAGAEPSGMQIDVTVAGHGLRFTSATTISMEQSTVVPAAAACVLMLAGDGPEPGVWPPEALSPQAVFAAASQLSPGGGGLAAWRLDDGVQGARVPMRELLAR